MAADERGAAWSLAERATFLKLARLFRELPPAALHDVAARFRPKRVARGEFVFHEGEPARTLGVLASGGLKIVRETEAGREVILRLVAPGEIFGAAGGWGEPTYPATAVALEDAVVLQLPDSEFDALLGGQPEFARAVVRELGVRLREARARIRDLQTEPVERRLARTLLRLAEQVGVPSPAGTEVAISRQHLGELAGTTLSTVSRTVSVWQQRGIVAAGRERVTIRQPAALAAIADEPV